MVAGVLLLSGLLKSPRTIVVISERRESRVNRRRSHQRSLTLVQKANKSLQTGGRKRGLQLPSKEKRDRKEGDGRT